jgi:hypothetical protein
MDFADESALAAADHAVTKFAFHNYSTTDGHRLTRIQNKNRIHADFLSMRIRVYPWFISSLKTPRQMRRRSG